MSTLISCDARGRASLGHPGQDYRLTEHPDGTLVLEPAVILSELEHKFLSNVDLQAEIAYYQAHPDQQLTSSRRRDRRNHA